MASAYWREREEENRRHLIANEKEMAAHAGDIYDRMMRSAQKEIDSFYQRYAKKEGITLADAKQRISKADMDYLSKQAAKYVGAAQRDMENGSGTTGDYFSKQADDEMRLYNATMKINRLEFLKGEIGSHLVDGFDEMNRYFDGKFTEQAMEEFRRRAVILGETVPADLEVRAEKIVNGSFRNAKYSDRLWQHQDMLRMEIGRQLERGLLQGVGSREQAREIRKIFGGSQKNAERLMRTEMCRISTEVAREHYQRNGNKHFQYMALGMNPCPICEALDGKIFPVSDMEAGLNAPPMHPNCHCSTGPAYNEEEEKLYNDWLDSGAAAEGVTLEEYENGHRYPSYAHGLAAKIGGGDVPLHEEPKYVRTIDPGDKAEIKRELETFAEKYRDAAEEHACVVTKKGEVYHCYGTDGNVYPDYDLGDELYGANVSHNHPEKETEYSFSKEDIELYLKYRLESLHGCDVKYDYELGDKSIGVDSPPDDWMNQETFQHSWVINKCEELGIGYRRINR